MEVKRILVTGGAGFIGHHLLRRLLKHPEYEIISLDRLDFSGNLNRIAELAQEFGPEEMRRLRVILHDLRAELNDQILKKFINFGTDEVFGDAPDDIEYHEWSRYNSRSPYSATKAGAEELCIAYENTYKMPIYVTHTMNVFGERQLPEKFLGIVMRQLLDDKPVVIHCDAETGTRSGLRHWIHAADVADATMFIISLPHGEFPIAHDEGGGTCPKFNIVGDREYSNLEVAEHVAKIMGRKIKTEMVGYDSQRPGHDFRYALSGEYMKSLGWIPSQDFETRLTQMVNWTLKNSRWLKL